MDNPEVWNKILSPGEEIRYQFSVGKQYLERIRDFWVIIGIFLTPLFGVGIIFIINGFLLTWYLRKSNNYAFTNKRVLILRGWLSTILVSIDYDKITDVTVKENFYQKLIFKTGRLLIDTAGSDFHEEMVVLNSVEDPYEVKRKLDDIRENPAPSIVNSEIPLL
jgi:uncharacterized membrane protein YdbT with pleckstrin-like domain